MSEPLPWELTEEPPPPIAKDRLCVVVAGQRLLGFAGEHSKGICHLESLTRVPRAPIYLLGVTNLHGNVAAVIDLCRPLDLPRPEQPASLGLIVVVDDLRAVLAVDDIVGFEPVDLDAATPCRTDLPADLRRFAVGETEIAAGRLAGNRIVILAADRLLQATRLRPGALADASPFAA